jgi:AcrR family transcriptional regulator
MSRVVIPRGPYQKGIRRRREIVDAASRIFARYGYGGSLRQIANDVGVTPAALARHFGNKYGLLQAVLTHWEDDDAHHFDGAQGLEYYRRLPGLMNYHTTEPGLIELLLTLATEATDPQHPARNWAVERYQTVVNLGIRYLREANELGEVGPMDDEQIEIEARAVFALMDGMQLQWLLDPSLPVVRMFEGQLNTILERWVRGAKVRAPRTRPAGVDGAAVIEPAAAPAIPGGTGDPAGRPLRAGGRQRIRTTCASIRRQANRRQTGVGTGVDDRKRSPGPSSSNSSTTRASESWLATITKRPSGEKMSSRGSRPCVGASSTRSNVPLSTSKRNTAMVSLAAPRLDTSTLRPDGEIRIAAAWL